MRKVSYYAHWREDEGTIIYQTVEEHCRQTAKRASECLEAAGLGQSAYLAGLLHDAGKCKEEFQDYLLNEGGQRGKVVHTFAGVKMLLEKHHPFCEDYGDVAIELLAYAIGAHHGQFDFIDEYGESGFEYRKAKQGIAYNESKNGTLSEIASQDELDGLLQQAVAEVEALSQKIMELAGANQASAGSDLAFYLSLTARLLLSAVIEGDRLDTATFMNNLKLFKQEKIMAELWQDTLTTVEIKINTFSADTPINQARKKISDTCRQAAEKETGLYRLHVPTGAGKTLSSLRYALAHAQRWNKKRIIFVTPLLSILDQNAKEIRNYIENDDIILEHHSNVIQTKDDGNNLQVAELAVENWDKPIIITTLVQLLDTLFKGKTTCIRRMQALCDAVIVIDEVQTVPNKMLSMFNLAVNFLNKVCNATVLMCSATQPCLEELAHPLLNDVPELVDYDASVWAPFKRTEILIEKGRSIEEISAFIEEKLENVKSLLVICNKKSEAEDLYRVAKEKCEKIHHISASMCMAHRRDVIDDLKGDLQLATTEHPVLCISTQVMEAGVDISFESVVRLSAGLDSIIQSAGRCNRRGEKKTLSQVYVVPCIGENLSVLQEIQEGKDATAALINAYEEYPEAFGHDLASNEAVAWYYKKLFKNQRSKAEHYHDYALPKLGTTVFDLLSYNSKFYDSERSKYRGYYTMNQALKLAGRQFRVFDENTLDVIVPYGEGKELINELCAMTDEEARFKLYGWNKRAKPYTIALYQYQIKKLENNLYEKHGVAILNDNSYNERFGLSLTQENGFIEI